MKEFWAEFDLLGESRKRDLIQYFVGLQEHPPSSSKGIRWENLEDPAARQHLLAQLLASEEECARRTKCKDYAKGKNGLQQWYYAGDLQNPRGDFQAFLCRRLRWMGSILGLLNLHDTVGSPLPNLTLFPSGSWAVQLTFTLRKPYISKDDKDFYILDNPVKKEWVFKVPYVAPSQWKGALRAAMTRQLAEEAGALDEKVWIERRLQLARLFGNEKGVDLDDERFEAYLDKLHPDAAEPYRQRLKEITPTGFLAGRLHFYPTFFDKIGLEVINPHDRKTGAGKGPIYFECVPADTQGVFTLLYVPLDNGPSDEATCKADLEAVARGICAMLTVYGFGAKTSSGYGVVEVNKADIQTLSLNAETVQEVWDILTQRHGEHGG
ncbi:hypothetical protein D6833_13955 [Candidatus Parcubacteria bacterium]|nr:MAG: hypothetical protein D6833_13955 [Candidatus Parcubacteria bacterium]